MDYSACSPLDKLIHAARAEAATQYGVTRHKAETEADVAPTGPNAIANSTSIPTPTTIPKPSFVVHRPSKTLIRTDKPDVLPVPTNFELFLPSEPSSPFTPNPLSSSSTTSLALPHTHNPLQPLTPALPLLHQGQTTSFYPDLHRLSSSSDLGDLSDVRSLAGERGWIEGGGSGYGGPSGEGRRISGDESAVDGSVVPPELDTPTDELERAGGSDPAQGERLISCDPAGTDYQDPASVDREGQAEASSRADPDSAGNILPREAGHHGKRTIGIPQYLSTASISHRSRTPSPLSSPGLSPVLRPQTGPNESLRHTATVHADSTIRSGAGTPPITLTSRSTRSDQTPSSAPAPNPTRPIDMGEHYLSLGISLHQKANLSSTSSRSDDLTSSALAFKRSMDAGSLGGKIMYGLSLRHGWGVAKDEARGFEVLSGACRAVMEQKDPVGELLSKVDKKTSHELILAIYEVGICFSNGWGVKQDCKKAVPYFRIAADFGDRDAQEQLGHLFSNGKHGVKKDMAEAAKWYRAAVAQGASSVGLSWIYKDKYTSGA